MGDSEHHSRIAREKRRGALDEYEKKRYTNVADLALKAVEQAVEAAAAQEGLHFHIKPRSAHADRVRWAKKRFPQLSGDFDLLWGAYGDLGYDGLNGRRAKEAVEAMERIMHEIEAKSKLRFE